MATRSVVASLARASLSELKGGLWNEVPLMDPQCLVASPAKAWLDNSQHRKSEVDQLLHKAEQVMLEFCLDYWRNFKHYQVSCGKLMHGCCHRGQHVMQDVLCEDAACQRVGCWLRPPCRYEGNPRTMRYAWAPGGDSCGRLTSTVLPPPGDYRSHGVCRRLGRRWC